MQHIKGSEFRLQNTSVTLGKFDGIHIGHQKLIRSVVGHKGFASVLFTFDLHPLSLFSEKEMKLIDTNTERVELLKESGLDYIIDYPFTTEVAKTEADRFIEEILHGKLGAKHIAVGSDFRFGRDRMGDVRLLEKRSEVFGYKLEVIPKELRSGREVSSTDIRDFIRQGKISEANRLLGRPFCISGEIIHGRKLGNTIGMPTINQKPEECKLLPPFGVYASETLLDGKRYRGITNIGVKPTVGETFAGAETWLFDFDEIVYGHFAKVYLLEFIREERKFASLEDLKKQVEVDVKHCKEVTTFYSTEVVKCL